MPCHFCNAPFSQILRGYDIFNSTRRFAHRNDPIRTSLDFDAWEERPAPAHCTHQQAVRQGKASDAYEGPQNAHPKKATGILGFCLFALLSLFDVIWDFPMDLMHIIKGVVQRHLIPLLKGERRPAPIPVPQTFRTTNSVRIPYTQEEKAYREKKYQKQRATYIKIIRVR